MKQMKKSEPLPDIITGNVYQCFFCKEYVEEVRDPYSGVLDYGFDGDFGCSENPANSEEGTGSHLPLTASNRLKIAEMLTGEKYATYAAAPELLEALKSVIEQLDGIGIPDWHGAEGLCLTSARAAIAKVEGR